MAIDDNTSYELTGAQVKDLATKISAKANTTDLPSVMTGATSQAAGTSGLVPAPTTSDVNKYLKGDGTWGTISAPTATLYSGTGQNTDGAMTQKAVTDTLFENNDTTRIKIGSGVTNSGAASIVIGSQGTQVLTPNSVAIGNGGTTSGSSGGSGNNVAIGSYGISATGGQSVAIGGNGAMAKAEAAIAIGSGGAEASGVNSIAIGRTTMASHKDSVALGTNAVTGRTSEISLGTNASGINPEKTKYIAHVTAGVNGTDAVNVAQLNAAIPGVMIGATSSSDGASGLVPAPAAGDDTKFLGGDRTWKTIPVGTTFYYDSGGALSTGDELYPYMDADKTLAATLTDISNAFAAGRVLFEDVYSGDGEGWAEVVYFDELGQTFGLVSVGGYTTIRTIHWVSSYFEVTSWRLQESLTAGSNITINGSTISATNTTYTAFTGATSSAAGASGLVPAPAVGDEDKYLKGDGTWAAISGGPTVVQTTGQSTTDVMSQKAVTDLIGNVETILQTLNSGTGAQ